MDEFFEEDIEVKKEDNFIITDEFKEALALAEGTDQHLFVTGDAGTGKSTWLKYFVKNTKKNCVKLAPTGIAAVNVGGQTIHSFFKWPPRPMTSADVKLLEDNEIFQEIDIMIIDEISMVRVDNMDLIDEFLRLNRSSNEPFGGVQMILIGDLLQLPPVMKSGDLANLKFMERYGCEYFFAADVWKICDLKLIKFTQNFRQHDSKFINILNRMRNMDMTYDDLDLLNEKSFSVEDEEGAAFLCALNVTADKINSDRIEKLEGEPVSYEMIKFGKTTNIASFVPETLTIKEGAKVMMLVNDPAGRWQNGTIGHIVECGNHSLQVDIYGVNYWITRHKWESVRHRVVGDKIETNSDGYIEQFPLKVAYAISIHKSQGQTFDSVIIDMGNGAFASGQGYVAVSRSKTLEGVFFNKPLRKSDVYFDPKVLAYLATGKYTR